jgi:hypothetical protein
LRCRLLFIRISYQNSRQRPGVSNLNWSSRKRQNCKISHIACIATPSDTIQQEVG